MKNKLQLSILLGIVLSAGLIRVPDIFCAEDYHWKFIVPVEAKNLMPEVTALGVSISFFKPSGSSTAGKEVSVFTHHELKDVVDVSSDGSFKGNIEVKVKSPQNVDPSDIKSYKIKLLVYIQGKNVYTSASEKSSKIWAKTKPGSDSVVEVAGEIPQ